MTSLAMFRSYFGALASVPDATVEDFLELAAGFMSATVWGACYQRGAVFLAAHLLLKMGPTASLADLNNAGSVTSRKDGDIAVNYGAVAASGVHYSDADLMTTAPCRMFLMLRGQLPASAPTHYRGAVSG